MVDGISVAARHFAESPQDLESGVLFLRKEWFTDVIPPGNGTDQLEVRLGKEGLRWELRTTRGNAAAETTTGSLGAEEGRQRFHIWLARLVQAGWAELTTTQLDPEVMQFAGADYQVSVRCSGNGKSCLLERRSPAKAAPEAGRETARAAVDKILGEVAGK
jgi:hypothetical protein